MDSIFGHSNKTKNEEQEYEEQQTNYKGDQEAHHKKQNKPPSTSELLASAKVVAEAAKSGFGSGGSEKQKMDKAKVADAAADLLEAASDYGKLEDKSYGKYVQQAEDYLHKYGDSTTNVDHHSSHSSTTVGSDDFNKSKLEGSDYKSQGDDGQNKSGGYGDYMKMAQGFLGDSDKKSSTHGAGDGAGDGVGADEESKSGGYGDYVKMAQGFLKK